MLGTSWFDLLALDRCVFHEDFGGRQDVLPKSLSSHWRGQAGVEMVITRMRMQHWDSVWVCRQRAKRGLLHVPRSSLAMSASPWLYHWDASSAQELVLGWPKVALGVCHRVSALSTL